MRLTKIAPKLVEHAKEQLQKNTEKEQSDRYEKDESDTAFRAWRPRRNLYSQREY